MIVTQFSYLRQTIRLFLLTFTCLNLLLSFSLQAQIEPVTRYETGANYQKFQHDEKLLTIPDAVELIVHIRGETEKEYDFLRIFNNEDKLLGEFSGSVNKKIYVPGDRIRVVFRADGRTSAKGVVVTIEKHPFDKIFQQMRSQLQKATQDILQSGSEQAYLAISEHINRLKNINDKISENTNVETLVNEIAKELMTISKTYRQIASQKTEILAKHQIQLDIITNLKEKTLSYSNNARKNIRARQNQIAQGNQSAWAKENIQRIIQLLEVQATVWRSLYENQQDIEEKLKFFSQRIGELLSFLELTAQVYEQTANLALLRKTTIMEFKELVNVQRLKTLLDDIHNTEEEIQSLFNNIEYHN